MLVHYELKGDSHMRINVLHGQLIFLIEVDKAMTTYLNKYGSSFSSDV